ncbi:MAG: zf-HC2 domain-containing protein [Gemmatimonadota bacterium]
MNPRHPTAVLSAWVDGELYAAERDEVESHLRRCAECAALAADLRALTTRAASLEDRPPAHDLWPGIRERLAASPRARVVPLDAARRISLSWTQLAAAAITLIVIAGGSVWLALSGREIMPGTGPSSVADRGTAGSGSADAVLAADFATESYDAAVADLEEALDASRDQLDPGTVATIERNLAIIDAAIAETRTALAADPNSVYLSAHLAEQMRRKLDILRVATTTVGNASL